MTAAPAPPAAPSGPEGGCGAIGVVMLVHTALDRAEQVIRHWSRAGCPVVVHVDAGVPDAAFGAFVRALGDLVVADRVAFSPRHRCEWGTWGLVAATQEACETLLARHPDARHVYLASGACLPLRPVAALRDYLAARPGTDFIESATTADVPWTVGGLSEERFTLRFPFSWKRHRRLFDGYVALQRRLGLRRRIPPGIVPHMGSQWWCLTRETLAAILADPERPAFDRYFRRVWIPDESYFQTLARRHSTRIESRSLTLSKFDFQGKPHIFYDDHLQLLRRSDCFVARKIWPHAGRLYDAFLGGEGSGAAAEPSPQKIDRVFARATERRTRGRPGLWMQSRWPHEGWENGVTAAPYSVFEGFAELFDDWEAWLARATAMRVHGHLFAPLRVEFEGGQSTFAGALSDNAHLRDHQPQMFLRNLIWNTRGERQAFQFGPADVQHLSWDIAKDPNAQVSVISGAWIVPLFRAAVQRPAPAAGGLGLDLRAEAARLQRIEADHLGALRSPYAKARVRIWTMAEFLEAPQEALQAILEEIGAQGTLHGGLPAGAPGAPGARPGLAAGGAPAPAGAGRAPAPAEAPRIVDLAGFARFLQDLKNRGMHPYLMGDFPLDPAPSAPALAPRPAPPPAAGPPRFDLFVVLADMRTGSNFLEANLNALPGVRCHGEAFNPVFVGEPDRPDLFGVTLQRREANPRHLVETLRAQAGLNGFRLFSDHDPRALDLVLPDPRVAKVVLTRNPVESWVSLEMARATDRWRLFNPSHATLARVRWDRTAFREHLDRLQAFQLRILRGLQETGQTAFWLDYEDLFELPVMNGLAAFLGVEGRLAQLDRRLKKQNPEPLAEKVEDYPAMEAALGAGPGGIDRFDLGRTPNFEPRRGNGTLQAVAALRAPLLFHPLRAGPEGAVRDWLAGLDPEGTIVEGFGPRTLRAWKAARPGHLSFTVLRHPLQRAHAALCERILPPEVLPEVRANMIRTFQLPVPPEGVDPADPGWDDASHRRAFARFLQLLRFLVAGQSSIRADPAWASQVALVQGIATAWPPDLVLREERLGEELAALARRVGHAAPPLGPTDPHAGRLARVHGPDLEALARAAVEKDYVAWGYGDWRPA